MAIPSFDGMLVVLPTVFTVPVFLCGVAEIKPAARNRRSTTDAALGDDAGPHR